MKFFCHFGISTFSNAYLLGPDDGGDAVLVDPGVFDETLLGMIEKNGLYIRHILLTHGHAAHVGGVKTIARIYDATLYAHEDVVLEWDTTPVQDGDHLDLGGIEFQVIGVPGHTPDSLAYRTGSFLFTGDTLFAGSVGGTQDPYSRGLILNSIHEKILNLDEEIMVFAGHGPPTKVGIEKHLNPDLQDNTLSDELASV